MARDEGTFDFSANFEVKTKGTIDARQLVETFSDLLNFTESNFIPTGFPVSVSSTSTFNGTEYTNGIYECIDEDNVGLEASWKKTSNYPAKEKLITVSLGDIGASDFEDDIPTKIKAYAISNSITRELNTLHKWKLTENPFEYAANGVTVVLKSGFPAGSSGTVDGDNSGKIYTAVNETQLRDIVLTGDANTDLTGFCTTLITNMEQNGVNTFYPSPFINSGSNQNISSWDVSNVTSMQGIFSGATAFNQPLDNWDVSSVTNMRAMFYGATSFNQPLDSWDVSNDVNMFQMFYGATSFNQPLNSWDVSNVNSSNMNSMFMNATSFNQPLDNWDVSNMSHMRRMFEGASSFNQDLSGWCVTNIGSEPYNFDLGASDWVLPNSRPIWGTCPED